MTKESPPFPPNFRELHRGAALAEGLMVEGAWDEFTALLRSDPGIARQILRWFMEPGDPEHVSLLTAQRIARGVLSQQ